MPEKKKVIIWGTGTYFRKLYNCLDFENVEVLAYTSTECEKRVDDYYDGNPLVPPWEALKMEYDYVLIASRNCFCEITNQLLDDGVKGEKIVQVFNSSFVNPGTLFYFNEIDPDRKKLSLFTSLQYLLSPIF